MGKIIGIDLGTTNSCVAVMEGRRKPVVIPNKEGSSTTPSIVAFAENGERMVGQVAKRQAIANSEGTIYAIKRLIGRKYDSKEVQFARTLSLFKITEAANGDAQVMIRGRSYNAVEISSMILEKMKKTAEDYLGEKVTSAVITVPHYFNYFQRQATKEAGWIAGFNILRIINEPMAAAIAYGLDKKKDEKIAVFDLGGGAFNISIIELGGGVFDIKSMQGDANIGGEDFDRRLIDYLICEFNKEQGIDIRKNKMEFAWIREAAESAKMELSIAIETAINLPYAVTGATDFKHMKLQLTRAKLEAQVENPIEKIATHCMTVLREAALNKSDIDKVILIGGMTRMPCIQQKAKEIFGKELYKGVNPDEVVAIGAAIVGAVLNGQVKEILPLDVMTFSVGIETQGGLMIKLIEKNTIIPTKRSQIFSTATDNQSVVSIHVLQGESSMATDNLTLGRFDLVGINVAPRGASQIEVTLEIDPNGTICVSAKDLATGKERSMKEISTESTASKKEKVSDPMLLPIIHLSA